MKLRPSKASRLALVRARLSLPTVRQAAGMFEGQHASIFTGKGIDFEDLVDYRPGDDVSDIDWKSSARAGYPIVRRFERDSDVFTQVVIDSGREMMASAPSGETKAEIALYAADILAYLASQRGDRLGMVVGDSVHRERVPARHGTSHLEYVLDRAERAMTYPRGVSDVDRLLSHVLKTTMQRSLVILVTDAAWPAEPDTLRKAHMGHQLIVVRVADMSMTADGVTDMSDIDGDVHLPSYIRRDRKMARAVTEDTVARQSRAASMLTSYAVPNVLVASSGEVPGALFMMLRRQSRG